MAALYVDEAARGKRTGKASSNTLSPLPHRPDTTNSISGLPAVTSMNVTAGSTLAMGWSISIKRYICTVIRFASQATQRSGWRTGVGAEEMGNFRWLALLGQR